VLLFSNLGYVGIEKSAATSFFRKDEGPIRNAFSIQDLISVEKVLLCSNIL
jgi:hypothetical protein